MIDELIRSLPMSIVNGVQHGLSLLFEDSGLITQAASYSGRRFAASRLARFRHH